MKATLATTLLAMAGAAVANKPSLLPVGKVLETRANRSKDAIPAYNFTMPVDHFNSSNKETYPNRYFVNDTYYKPGGPVILHDHGESGISTDNLNEAQGQSLPLRLAAKLNGLVIEWEHRYYGYSWPVPLNATSGLPVNGARGYQYLSAEQALEDVAFFANNFNKTSLGENKVVQNTANLDPYHIPWIFVGGSYPGVRAAWMRIKHPEVIYASYSSSAPVQYQFDGSLYYSPVVRSMPTNCSSDIKAAIKYFDQTLAAGSSKEINQTKAAVYLATDKDAATNELNKGLSKSNFDTALDLSGGITLDAAFQEYGPVRTTQIMCDLMQGFDTRNFSKENDEAQDVVQQSEALFGNPGGKTPTKNGIAANNGKDGERYAFSALMYAIFGAKKVLPNDESNLETSVAEISKAIDDMSWNWQTVSQTGIFQGSNPENVTVVSRLYNMTAVQDIRYKKDTFPGFTASDFPEELNNTGLKAFDGWNMKVSNVMFTNGEFDPWRAFSVASEEAGAPERNIVQKVPECNQLPPGSDKFGITYAGASHCNDMSDPAYSSGSSSETGKMPLDRGLELFLSGWEVWAPCFNQSRDDVRNGKGVDGNGRGANGSLLAPGQSGAKQLGGISTLAEFIVVIFKRPPFGSHWKTTCASCNINNSGWYSPSPFKCAERISIFQCHESMTTASPILLDYSPVPSSTTELAGNGWHEQQQANLNAPSQGASVHDPHNLPQGFHQVHWQPIYLFNSKEMFSDSHTRNELHDQPTSNAVHEMPGKQGG